ncbi:alpha/beta hydrolase [Dyadobacter subterraneus]|uniref:Alpha/beta hydrolase n=1 Tax=Dyadobacter subterraneus TaxID=2773304 RepID=A0ABR9W7F5_9BACT|nr:alpha/beta hydrolase [Dyadobacter subterraneus]MBE9461358.1 alpha/beta hydrolase [Dyadobacter subterraneus]
MKDNKYLSIGSFLKTFMITPDETPTLQQVRDRQAAYGLSAPLPFGWETKKMLLGNVPVLELSGPEATKSGAILFFHAGGYSAGSAADHAGLAAKLGCTAQVKCYCVDYRLAPEQIFPAAVEDSYNAYIALINLLDKDTPVVLAGDSAGGGLAVAITQLVKARGEKIPSAVYAISPWADMNQVGESFIVRGPYDPMLSKESLNDLRDIYLNGHDPSDPRASPVNGDFENFPSLLIHVGANEVLLSDALRLTSLSANAGNDVTLKVWQDMIHIFPWFYPHLEKANQAIEAAGAWLCEIFDQNKI